MFFRKKSGGPEWLLVCLGNPGREYEQSRHNVGFLAADALSRRENARIDRLKFHALTGTVELGGSQVLVLKPQTYMNLSGRAVAEAASFYKIPPERVLVIFDDVSLAPGKLRIRKNGSAGGHNGIKSIISSLGSQDFPRIKIGVGGTPHPDYDLADWVLSAPAGEDKKLVEQAILRSLDAAEELIRSGPDAAMNRHNG